MFESRFALIPFAKRIFREEGKLGGEIGYSEYFIFGVRIAKIQQTKPW